MVGLVRGLARRSRRCGRHSHTIACYRRHCSLRVGRAFTIARAFGHEGLRVTTRSQLLGALEAALDRSGLTVVVAEVPSRDENVRLHDEWNERVKSILESVR